ncbi:MAG: hypothetical protein ACRDO7_05130 [Nocardioidaceae bacterium]
MPSMPSIITTRQVAAHRAEVHDRSSYLLIGAGLVALLVAVLAVVS